MEEYDRTENPAALGWTFETLRQYHHALREDLDEVIRIREYGQPIVDGKP